MKTFTRWAAVAIWALGGVAWADDPKPVSDRAKQQVAAELVEQLGSRDFNEREAAEKKLLELGGVVADVVKAGLKSESEEVAARCERILPKLRSADLQRPDHPVWKRFVGVTGDTPQTKKWYDAVLVDGERAAALERITTDPKTVTQEYQTALDAMVAKHGGSDRRFGSVWPAQPPDPSLTFLLFLGSSAETAKVVSAAKAGEVEAAFTVLVTMAFNTGNHQRGDGRMLGAPAAEMRQLLAAWAKNRSEPAAAKALALASFWGESPHFPDAVRAALTDKSLLAAERGWLAQHLGQFGDATDVPRLAKLFGDDAEFARVKLPDGDILIAQVGDAARASCVRLLGHDPADLGFARWNRILPEKGGNGYQAEFARCGFVDDDVRKSAAAAVDELLKLPVKPGRTARARPVSIWDDPALLRERLPETYTDPADPKEDAFWKRAYTILHTGYSDDDSGRVYAAAVAITAKQTTAAANTFTRKLADRCLRCSRDTADRAAVRTRLASVLIHLPDSPAPEERAYPVRRAKASYVLLDAYTELLDQKLPDKKPELPKVEVPGAEATAKERAEFAMANTARRDAQYVCDLLDARTAVVDKLRELYKPDPDELKALAEKKLPKEAVDELMKQIK